ncbi:hypothetical protein CISIN_1g044810mg [Citrus sinensis]|uniref:Uncharacterized protein n=1 Tax=Citrus sinensis TaxID=2711 RepID=A0A067DI08_CITSI|nr:hypothetical protein CISIN_1g044810mg [Citrus sinensis]
MQSKYKRTKVTFLPNNQPNCFAAAASAACVFAAAGASVFAAAGASVFAAAGASVFAAAGASVFAATFASFWLHDRQSLLPSNTLPLALP